LALQVAGRRALETLRSPAYHFVGADGVSREVPGKPVNRSWPITLAAGCAVVDFAGDLDRQFADWYGRARIWGHGVIGSQTAKRDHKSDDSNVVELHVS
jgi:ribosome-interacting GTPase 1